VATPFQGQCVIRRLGFAMFKPHTKFKVSTITCNEEMKGKAKCKTSHFEPPFGDLGVTHGVHLWLDGKLIVGTIKRNLSKSAFFEGVGHFERIFW